MTRSPTAELLAVFVAVFVLQRLVGVVGVGPEWFALALPLGARPWTLVTSVYAHRGLAHLLANALALAVVGFALERTTTRVRFHAFVLATGALSAVAQVLAGAALGTPTAVLGASGAVLALYGYALVANPVAAGLLARLDLGRRGRMALFAGVALLATAVTAAPGVALVAHFAGFLSGVGAGRLGVLRVRG